MLIKPSRALALLLVLPVLANAASYNCSGSVDQVTVDPNGEVNASFTFDGGGMSWQAVCSLNENPAFNVTPAACKGILATLLLANQTRKHVRMWFDNDTNGSCSAPQWQKLRQSGWYWGPSLQG
ncbi:hypothetical protein CDN99_20425 [Roseateles aquatilis]|uniref:Uncharacterized protein n=1 Tax=Roseateles aquatilis TaxID=431061 RepID=A0A246J0W6_9BURK|nr:hypothetical protein [Roseateles aquatilis]OWQ86205.1 hypothetical protein CDN99_20425 [Roseateles aquatilis]